MAGSARSAAAKHGYGRMFAPTWGSAAARGGAAEEFDESDVWGSFGSAADYSPADLARAAAARPIPQPVLVRAGAGSGRKNPQLDRPAVRGSLPMSIPDWQKILGVEYRDHYRAGEWEVNGGDDDDYGKVMIPPHELAWRSRAASMSVHEGIGRTLKGRHPLPSILRPSFLPSYREKQTTKKMESKRVGIVGAGVSGLAACKHALDKGFSPVVFEADDTVGGVWAHTLQSTRLQAPTSSFRFSDLAWPASVTATYPSHHEVMEYLRSYACQFDLLKCIKFNSQVLGIDYLGATEEEIMGWEHWSGNGKALGAGKDGGWRLTVKDLKIGNVEVFEVDFLILCIGRHSGTPNIPEFPENKGFELFKGKILHSVDYSYMDDVAPFVKGKSVTIIGSGKSAFDIAAEVAKVNGTAQPCTMIYRTKHWLVHKSSIWGINLSYFYLNRISQLLVHKPGEGFLHYILASALAPLRWAITKVIETYFKQSIPLQKHGMVPDYSFSFAMSSCLIAMLPEGFYDRVDEGSIVLKKSKRFSFYSDGIILEDRNECIKSDIIILATGFRGDQKLRDIFMENWCRKIVVGSSDTPVPLYRECIHPRIPQLAIVGYSESLTNIYASERMAHWVIHFLAGGFQLPSIRCMEESVAEWGKYKDIYNGKYFRRSCISTVNIWFNDLLCKDIGCTPRRKKGFLAEWFQPYGPADYAGLC